MDRPKLLIADSNPEFRKALHQALSGISTVRSCGTGTQALEQLHSFRPDILVVDLMLPEIDGISLLHRAAEADLHPAVLATSLFTSPYVTAALARLEVDYVLPKPCNIDSMVCHIRDMASQLRPMTITQADLQSASVNLLLALGFSTKLDGFGYLQAALPLFAQDPEQAITKELYTAVGKLYHKDARQVERSIRNAIEIAWRNRVEENWANFLPCGPGGRVPKPTNGYFISLMATYLANQMENYKIG